MSWLLGITLFKTDCKVFSIALFCMYLWWQKYGSGILLAPLIIICNSKQIIWFRMFRELCNDCFVTAQIKHYHQEGDYTSAAEAVKIPLFQKQCKKLDTIWAQGNNLLPIRGSMSLVTMVCSVMKRYFTVVYLNAITESPTLEKTSEIIQSNCPPIINISH